MLPYNAFSGLPSSTPRSASFPKRPTSGRLGCGQAFAPKWSLGFGTTSMTIADAPDADERITDYIDKCRHSQSPCDSVHFGSGYTSIGPRRYAFNWNRDKFPDPAAMFAELAPRLHRRGWVLAIPH